MVNELKLVSDEPGHSATSVVVEEPEASAAPNGESHPLDDAADAYAASVKQVRLKKAELRVASDAAAKLDRELSDLVVAEQSAFEKLQTERDAADLPKPAPPEGD